MTTCLDCMISTGVGQMYGFVGLPTLDETPYAKRTNTPHGLGGDPDNETFGFLEAGFRAIGLSVHALDVHRAFLERHKGHRLIEWSGDERHEQLPPELRGEDRTKMTEYKAPRLKDGYVRRTLAFECGSCQDRFESATADWVKPFEPMLLSREQVNTFRERVCGSAECNILEAEPFGILYMNLDEWLDEHGSHKVTMKLDRDREDA